MVAEHVRILEEYFPKRLAFVGSLGRNNAGIGDFYDDLTGRNVFCSQHSRVLIVSFAKQHRILDLGMCDASFVCPRIELTELLLCLLVCSLLQPIFFHVFFGLLFVDALQNIEELQK